MNCEDAMSVVERGDENTFTLHGFFLGGCAVGAGRLRLKVSC
jgi:hypothetical protein